MGDAAASFTPDSTIGAPPDLDFIHELLSDGCWLQAANHFKLTHPSVSTSTTAPILPQQNFPSLDYDTSNLELHPHPQPEAKQPSLLGAPKIETNIDSKSQNWYAVQSASSFVQPQNFPIEGTELGGSWWIGPIVTPGSSSSVRERLIHAVDQLKVSTKDRNILIQIWVPVKQGGKQVLTTVGQPYLVNRKCQGLASYRNVSKDYHFPADEGSNKLVGLPGRVFLRKLPEWTPDVRFFSCDEYPRKYHANQYNICGSLAVPVFEQGSGTCLGVVEVVTTTQKTSYRPELEDVCKALEAVNLQSSQYFSSRCVKAFKDFSQVAGPEISEILGSLCKSHQLPLALLWAPCFERGKAGCQHFDGNYAHCISTVDSACFVADKHFWEFFTACSEQCLVLGQGIVGRAFETDKQCFSMDITAFSKTDYPLSHYAMMFGLHTAIAIPLRRVYAGSTDFVVELFLPKDCQDNQKQKHMCDLLPIALQQACRSLHVTMEKGCEEDSSFRMAVTSNAGLNEQKSQKSASSSKESFPEGSSKIASMMEAQQKSRDACVPLNILKEEFKVKAHLDMTQEELHDKQVFTEFGKLQHDKQVFTEFGKLQSTYATNGHVEGAGSPSFPGHQPALSRRSGERRRTRAEKTINLEILRHYFAGSLKDAAKSIGVCPTTLKRICRQYGINRWPSRKIKKVGHSLKKLQLVIDSVQGANSTIQIGSFCTSFPELPSPRDVPFSSTKMNGASRRLCLQHGVLRDGVPPASISPLSSCSRSSGSSICCSTGAKQHRATKYVSASGDALMGDDHIGVFKRAHSVEELKLLPGSQSPRTFGNHPCPEALLPPLPGSSDQASRERNGFRVKATFGVDKVQFSLQPNWGFIDLQQEVAKCFKIDDVCQIGLKYLDDDHEWVLLTCDADLEECKDIYRLYQSHTIEISLHQASQLRVGSWPGSGRI